MQINNYHNLFTDFYDTLNPEHLYIATQFSIGEAEEYIALTLGVSKDHVKQEKELINHLYYQYKFADKYDLSSSTNPSNYKEN